MLEIKIQLIPYGLSEAKSFWIGEIWNDATGTNSLGNYKFRIYKKNSIKTIWKGGEIKNFQRKNWSIWYLLYLCLKTVYGENND